jgi:hypothetical protein
MNLKRSVLSSGWNRANTRQNRRMNGFSGRLILPLCGQSFTADARSSSTSKLFHSLNMTQHIHRDSPISWQNGIDLKDSDGFWGNMDCLGALPP